VTASPLPIARFSTEALPQGERFATWRDAIATLYEVTPPSGAAREPFSAEATSIHLGPLIVGAMCVDALAYDRSAARIRSDSLDHFILGLDDPGPAPNAVPRVLIQDLGQPLTLPTAPLTGTCIILPRDVMAQVLPGADTLHGVRIVGTLAQLLAEHTRSLLRAAPTLTVKQAPQLARATQQLIAACLAPTQETLAAARPQLQATVMVRARRYIERNLMEPDLSSARIGAALGLSRSSLYELFAPFNGVARYIQGRRLERIHVALADPTEHRRIADIADDYGLTSEAHFSRIFRRRFGYAPREIRGTGLGRPAHGPARGAGSGTGPERLAFPGWVEQLGE
jgi:AraC-like DNA-binding protein